MMLRSLSLFALLLALMALPCAADDAKKPPRASDLPKIEGLPDPFLFADGKQRVKTADDWKRRRQEIKGLFEDYVYGHLPPKPEKMTVTAGDVVHDKDTKTKLRDLSVKLEHKGKSMTFRVRLAWPEGAKKSPVLIQSGFGKRSETPTGKPFAFFTKRGYAVAECYFNEFALDFKGKARSGGVYRLFGDGIDCGALLAWAWGVHRVIDVLETIDVIDATKVIVTGHSRYGKATLLAGAFDERIAVTVPSHSGAAGCAPFRFIYGKSEQLHNIAGAFHNWFRPDFDQFVGKVDRLPVDQHELLALVAPRALLQTEGTKDAWTNPEGSQLTHQAAKKVYDFLKAGDRISVRYRPVGHVPSNADLLDFADHVFHNKELSADFGKLAYKEETKAFGWDVPKK